MVPVNVRKHDLSDVEAQLKIAQGFDIGLEMSGNQIALNQMIEALLMGGRIALLGIPPDKSSVDWSRIVFRPSRSRVSMGARYSRPGMK